jgi:hypothetical protein
MKKILNSIDYSETITSVLCVPIKSLQKSSQGMPDWICVILGFHTGFVRMYTVVMELTYFLHSIRNPNFSLNSHIKFRMEIYC